MTWTKRIALTLGLTACFYAGSMAGPGSGDAHVLWPSQAHDCLHGVSCPYGDADNDINLKKRELENAGWCIDHSWERFSGQLNGDDHFVVTVQRYLTCKGYLLDRAFDSKLINGSNRVYDDSEKQGE